MIRMTLLTASAVAGTAAADQCPAPASDANVTTRPAAPTNPLDTGEEFNVEMDAMEVQLDGTVLLKGRVDITQGERRLTTRDARYDPVSQSLSVEHGVEYADPDLAVRGSGAQFDPLSGATFEGAEFELPTRQGRGSAGRITATVQGDLQLDEVRFTTCPVGNDDWMLSASDIDISQRRGTGTGRGVRLDFKGVPILYSPWFSFPVGNQRKSGFLYPTLDTSGRSGAAIYVPWYWNIAPNYDATFVPTWYSKRGPRLESEFRYLAAFGRGMLTAELLPDDQEYGAERSFVRFTDQSDFTRHLRLNIDAANASDSDWFEDFGSGPEGTSTLYLNRSADLTWLSDHWYAVARAQNFQTIDDTIDPSLRPYTILPQFAISGSWPRLPFGLAVAVDAEVSNFDRSFTNGSVSAARGLRYDLAPRIHLPLRSAGVYLEPAASWRYTGYRLDDSGTAQNDSPHRSTPVLSLDGGMIFERPSGSHEQRLLTLEPRFMYLYVPYRNQDELPVFDTAAADLNLVQLFRTNRYVGADRLSDANQITIGATTRLLDADTGQQFIAATIGQAYYFDAPRVALPGEILDDIGSSDIIAELDLTAYRNWNIRMGVQWDPGDTRSEKGDLFVQYKPDDERVVNLGYRFRRSIVEQIDGSIAWPLAERWGAYARMVYSLADSTSLNQFAGLEYRSCCWRLRFLARRYVRSRDGDMDSSIMVQLELNGLSSVGNADAFLERSIQGYSLRPSTPLPTR